MCGRILLLACLWLVGLSANLTFAQFEPREQRVFTIDAEAVRDPHGLKYRLFNLSCTLPGIVQFHRSPIEMSPISDHALVLTDFGTLTVSFSHFDRNGHRVQDSRLNPFLARQDLRILLDPNTVETLREFESDLAMFQWLLSLKPQDIPNLEGPRRTVAEAALGSFDFVNGNWLVVTGKSATAVLAIQRRWVKSPEEWSFRMLRGYLFDERGMVQMRMSVGFNSPRDSSEYKFQMFLTLLIGSARFSDEPEVNRVERLDWIGFKEMGEARVCDDWISKWEWEDPRLASLDHGPEEVNVEADRKALARIKLRKGGLVWQPRIDQLEEKPATDREADLEAESLSLVVEGAKCKVSVSPRAAGEPPSFRWIPGGLSKALETRMERLYEPTKTELENALRIWRMNRRDVQAATGEQRIDFATAFVLFRVDARTPDYVFHGPHATVVAFLDRDTAQGDFQRYGFRPYLRCTVFDRAGRERAVVRFAGKGVSEAGLLDLAKQLAANAEWTD